MQPGEIDRSEANPPVYVGRALLLALVLGDLLALEPAHSNRGAIVFVAVYLAVAIVTALWAHYGRASAIRLPYAVDIAGSAALLVLSPSVTAFWMFYLFVSFAVAAQAGQRNALVLGAIATIAVPARQALLSGAHATDQLYWWILAIGTALIGTASGFLGVRERGRVTEARFLEDLVKKIQVEQGVAESLRSALDLVVKEFSATEVMIAARDEELDRVFLWRVRPADNIPIVPETLPITRADAYLADDLETSVCWNSLEGAGEGFGWRRNGRMRHGELPRLPTKSHQALGAQSLMVVTLDSANKPTSRLLVLNGKRRFATRDLRWLEQIARTLGPPLENLFQLRHLRARAIEADRSRISRDLHDGILQTLLSLNIQLDVLRKKLPNAPEQAEPALAGLQETVKKEGEELRRMVTDLRPLHIESADLIELMTGFAERYQNEAAMVVDLFVESAELQIPDRFCRELFQIYRESLNNIKKHARASHVVIKLWQDESKVSLVVDDNGQGFSFAGRYTSEELDRLRLGPISIKERTRSVGGTLTVESTPGHGARLTVEIPLS